MKNAEGFGMSTFANGEENFIETSELRLRGHLLTWKGIAIQISNISMMHISDVQTLKLPIWVLAILVLGVICVFIQLIAGLILIIVGGVFLYLWTKDVGERRKHKYLKIMLNSGRTYSIHFKDKDFLEEVFNTLENVFESGPNLNNTNNITFDMENCKIIGPFASFSENKN